MREPTGQSHSQGCSLHKLEEKKLCGKKQEKKTERLSPYVNTSERGRTLYPYRLLEMRGYHFIV